MGTVLEARQDGPLLCLGVVLDSLPPQCGGIPIAGWDWDAVTGEETAGGTTWGDFEVTGRYDGKVFTLLEAGPPHRPQDEGQDDPIVSGCSEPAGGWERPNPALTSERDRQKAISAARGEPDFAGAWLDYIDEPTEFTDPQDVILTLAFTDDLEGHENDIRKSWGGPLCVVEHAFTLDRLEEIRDELHSSAEELELQILWSSVSENRNVVELGVVVLDPATQNEIDERYGEGTVEITPRLRPAP